MCSRKYAALHPKQRQKRYFELLNDQGLNPRFRKHGLPAPPKSQVFVVQSCVVMNQNPPNPTSRRLASIPPSQVQAHYSIVKDHGGYLRMLDERKIELATGPPCKRRLTNLLCQIPKFAKPHLHPTSPHVSGVERLSRGRVHLTDGSSHAVDAFIACTGYQITFPFLPLDLVCPDKSGYLELYHYIMHPREPTLNFICQIDALGGQARWDWPPV